jgi:enterochelin esterase-like enzyme
MKRLLEDKGVKYTLLEVPGYGHEWKFWRLSLRDLLPRLFQQGSS